MRALLLILVIGGFFVSCSEENVELYKRKDNYIFFVTTSKMWALDSLYRYASSVYVPSYNKTRDTVYFRVGVGGNWANGPRKIKLEQYAHPDDPTIPDAVPGEDYVAFDDPVMEEHYTIPADSLEINIPVIITSKTSSPKMLDFRLVDTDDFKVMYKGTKEMGNPAGRIRIN